MGGIFPYRSPFVSEPTPPAPAPRWIQSGDGAYLEGTPQDPNYQPPAPAAPKPVPYLRPSIQQGIDTAVDTGKDLLRRGARAATEALRYTPGGLALETLNPEWTGDPITKAKNYFGPDKAPPTVPPVAAVQQAKANRGADDQDNVGAGVPTVPVGEVSSHGITTGPMPPKRELPADYGKVPSSFRDDREAIRAQLDSTDWNRRSGGDVPTQGQLMTDDRARAQMDMRDAAARRRIAEDDAATGDPVQRTLEGYAATEALNEAMPSRRGAPPQPFTQTGPNSYATNQDEEPRMSVGESRKQALMGRQQALQQYLGELKAMPEMERDAEVRRHIGNLTKLDDQIDQLRRAGKDATPLLQKRAELRDDLQVILPAITGKNLYRPDPNDLGAPAVPATRQTP